MWRHRWIYVLLIPPLTYYFILRYIPLFNALIAFKDFRPLLGVVKSPWVGFQHFRTFIKSFYFDQLITNTLIFSGLKLLLGMPTAIVLAIALHETRFLFFRSLV
jgi:putative aldouronate transport system permease protein